jgi:hypothetical protein
MAEIVLLGEGEPNLSPSTYEEHVDAFQYVDKSMAGHFWMLGAIAASLETRYGEGVMGKFASDVGYSRRRVDEFAQTYDAWRESGDRSPILSFKHHTLAARAADPPKALAVAEDEQLSTRELETFIETGELPRRGDRKHNIENDEGGNDETTITRIVRASTMTYVAEYGDGKRFTVTRSALEQAGFEKCSECTGHGLKKKG